MRRKKANSTKIREQYNGKIIENAIYIFQW